MIPHVYAIFLSGSRFRNFYLHHDHQEHQDCPSNDILEFLLVTQHIYGNHRGRVTYWKWF